jgi:hypothetical protein
MMRLWSEIREHHPTGLRQIQVTTLVTIQKKRTDSEEAGEISQVQILLNQIGDRSVIALLLTRDTIGKTVMSTRVGTTTSEIEATTEAVTMKDIHAVSLITLTV